MKPGTKPKVSPLAKKQDAKGRGADGSSAPNCEARVWKAGPRPPGAAPWQDSSFALEDDALSSSLETLFSCFCCWDPALPGCPIVSASPGFEALTGYSASDYLGRSSSSKLLQGPKTEPEAVAALSAGVDSGAFTSVEVTFHRQDGRPFRSLVCLVPLLDPAGGVAVWCEVHCDLEEKRKGSDEQFVSRWAEQVKNHSSNYLLLDATSEEGLVTGVGAGLTHLTGYTTPNLAGCSCLCLAGPTTHAGSMKKLMGCLGGSQKQAATTMQLHRRDGSAFWAHVVACPLGLNREQQQLMGGYGYHQPASQFYGSSSPSAASAAAAAGQQGAGGGRAPLVLVLVLDVTQQRPKRLGKYLLGKVLGQGASGLVRMGKNTTNDELVAVKSVDASRFRSLDEIQQVQEEMAVLSQLKHPNIIRLQEVHFSGNVFFFIMDWASGGSLVQYIYSHEGHALAEKEAHRIFSQLLSGLEYCHKRRVIHRDLKPENILMEGGNPKIADFGLAGVMAPFNAGGFTLQCGTPEFTAPEIVEGKEYAGPAVDLWSVGVMLYEALSGELPFKGSSQSALFAAIKKGVYPPLPANISAEGKDFAKRLLTTDPALRITWSELNRHPWLAGPGSSSSSSSNNIAGNSSNNTTQAGCASAGGAASHACSSAGGTEAAGGEGSRSGRGSEGGGDEPPCREISDAAALSESSELSGSLTLEDGDGPEGCGDAAGEPGSSSSGFNGSLRRSKGEEREGRSSWGEMPDLLRGGRGGGAAGLSFTSNRCHDSVRVVIPGGTAVDKDDPILAAIMRTAESFSAGISPASASARSHLLEEFAPAGSGPVSPRSASFSTGSASPGAPGYRGGPGGNSGAAGLGGRGPLGAVAKNLVGSPGGGPRGLRANSSSNLPPLSPTSSTEGSASAAAAAAAAARRVPSTTGQAAAGALGGSRAGAGALGSNKQPPSSLNSSLERGAGLGKEPIKSLASGLGSGAQQKGGGGGGSGQASPTSMLPPIGRDRGTPGRSLR